MKLILSRKGFDSSAGGVASPIFPDGALLSLPIPDDAGTVTYADLGWGDHALGEVVEGLTRGRVKRWARAHLDPDLYTQLCPRLPGWRPLFGQAGVAQSHLANQGVGVGDLFLFFGWFRAVEQHGGRYDFVKTAPDQHLIYGWLQVGRVLTGAEIGGKAPAWAMSHPHCTSSWRTSNTLYLASDRLRIADYPSVLPGAGYLPECHEDLCLTAPGRLRSQWRLPHWFYPSGDKPPLSYHADPARWDWAGDHAYLRSATRGQEFVLDTIHYPAALPWVAQLLGRIN